MTLTIGTTKLHSLPGDAWVLESNGHVLTGRQVGERMGYETRRPRAGLSTLGEKSRTLTACPALTDQRGIIGGNDR